MFPRDSHSSLVKFLSLGEEQDEEDEEKEREKEEQVEQQEVERTRERSLEEQFGGGAPPYDF